MGKKIIVLDDSVSVRRVVSIALSSAGHVVYEPENSEEAIELYNRRNIDVFIYGQSDSDIEIESLMDKFSSLDNSDRLRLILLGGDSGGYGSTRLDDAFDVVVRMHKPFHPLHLLATVEQMVA